MPRRRILLASAIALLVLLALPLSGALAYGKQDQPLAQLAFSGNCDNPDFPLCAPPPAGFGTGGIWLWIEVDANGTGDVAGAGCGHTVGGVGGPGGAGAGSIRGEITWQYSSGANLPANAFVVGVDPTDTYYLVVLDPEDVFAFPVTQGHYSFQPAPGVSIQAQVAP